MKKITKRLLLLTTIILLQHSAMANQASIGTYSYRSGPKIIGKYVDQLLDQMEQNWDQERYIKEDKTLEVVRRVSKPDQAMYFHRFKIRLEPYVAFKIASAVELKLYPLVEVEFIRSTPKGWATYHPNTRQYDI